MPGPSGGWLPRLPTAPWLFRGACAHRQSAIVSTRADGVCGTRSRGESAGITCREGIMHVMVSDDVRELLEFPHLCMRQMHTPIYARLCAYQAAEQTACRTRESCALGRPPRSGAGTAGGEGGAPPPFR